MELQGQQEGIDVLSIHQLCLDDTSAAYFSIITACEIVAHKFLTNWVRPPINRVFNRRIWEVTTNLKSVFVRWIRTLGSGY
jgi:hypothetical protein